MIEEISVQAVPVSAAAGGGCLRQGFGKRDAWESRRSLVWREESPECWRLTWQIWKRLLTVLFPSTFSAGRASSRRARKKGACGHLTVILAMCAEPRVG
jgi:hypothetical protein